MGLQYRGLSLLFLFFLLLSPLTAQEQDGEEAGGMGFAMTIQLGAQSFNEGDSTDPVTYQSLSLYPEFIFGKVGVGLAFEFNYRFVDDEGESSFELREKDWVPEGDQDFIDLYLPLLHYIRYGYKGEPLYGKIGSIHDATLGTGFVMANYSNMLFLPERRIIGLALDVDGSLFDFPYMGMESFVGNLASFDVFGTRLYARPLIDTTLPLLKHIQIGASFAGDREPEALYPFTRVAEEVETVTMFSIDFIQPLLNKNAFNMSLYGDATFQPGNDELNSGLLVGLGGKALGFIDYGLNSLFLGDNFVPFYFDGAYDLFREAKYRIYKGETPIEAYAGWQVSLGFKLLMDTLVFKTSLDAAFVPDSSRQSTLPHLRSSLVVGEGLLPGIFFDLTYDKRYITSFEELIDPEDALILANLNYKTGPAIITFGYTLRYVPEDASWETTAALSSSIRI